MSDSAARAQRSAVLEERRRRLEELKNSRKRRDEDTAKIKVASSSNLDEYIDGLLSHQTTTATTTTSATGGEGGTSSKVSLSQSKSEDDEFDETKSTESGFQVDAVYADAKSTQSVAADASLVAPAPPIPKQVEMFTVSTQTEEEDFPEALEPDVEEEEVVDDKDTKKALTTTTAATDATSAAFVEEELPDPKVLSPEQVQKEVSSGTFSSFINTASKKVERVLGTPLLADLLVDLGETNKANEGSSAIEQKDSSRFISSRIVLECPKWTMGRDVTDMDWSSLHRELMLSTYHSPLSLSSTAPIVSTAADSIHASSSSLTPRSGDLQSAGLALIWSLAMPTRPEHIFTSGSPVTAGRFHPTESPLLLGGLESGQLVVWDVRAGRLPVQKSALTSTTAGRSTKSHTYPLTGMEIIEGGLGLATTSTDGRVNFWSFASLREPAESLQACDSVSCFTVLPESDGLLVGDDNGNLYAIGTTVVSSSSTASSSSAPSGVTQRSSSRKQVRKLEPTTSNAESGGSGESSTSNNNAGHFGVVTALSAKVLKKGAASRNAGLSKGFLRGSGGLVLSSGVDWTTKLWAPAYSDAPLLSIMSHSYDYMSDVKWSPSHPSLFATASSNGTVGLWNFANSLDEPLTGAEGLVVESVPERGLNKLKWSSDGRRLAVASADLLHVLTLNEDVARPKGDEDDKIMNQLMARGLITRQ